MAQNITLWSPSIGEFKVPNLTGLGFQFGLGGAIMLEEGNIYREVLAGRNSVNQAGDTVIATYTIPGAVAAASFDVSGRGVNLLAEGSVAANVNSKNIKLYWGCTAAVIGSVV